ncbi:MAG TPA: hypothetical protein VHS32_05270 [Streptosporangiaceae bacterium]|nr:hypothetical protein [Streptosporangiaceae bacterium]
MVGKTRSAPTVASSPDRSAISRAGPCTWARPSGTFLAARLPASLPSCSALVMSRLSLPSRTSTTARTGSAEETTAFSMASRTISALA